MVGSTNLDGMEMIDLLRFWGETTRLVATMVLSLLLMIVPLASAAWFADYFRRNHPAMARSTIEFRALGMVALTTLLALAATRVYRSTSSLFTFTPTDVRNLLILALPLLGHALAVHYILRIVYRGGGKYGGLLVFVWIFSLTVLPLIADFFIHVAMQQGARELGGIASLSPVGTAVLVHRMDAPGWERATSPVVGAGVQLLAGLALAATYYATGRSRGVAPKPAA
jgi:hypothetical protein